jgi:hypothetical protein
MMPYWKRAEELDAEIQSIMGSSEFIVYLDEPHSCVHIFRDGYEFTSALFPFDDAIRNDLRQAAYLLHNGLDADERQRVADANEKVEAYGERQKEEAKADWRDESVWEYEHRFEGRQVTPMVVLDGGKK